MTQVLLTLCKADTINLFAVAVVCITVALCWQLASFMSLPSPVSLKAVI